jgi:hypothetical protein
MRAFPHPHFDKQIPDQQVDLVELDLESTFHEGGMGNDVFIDKPSRQTG